MFERALDIRAHSASRAHIGEAPRVLFMLEEMCKAPLGVQFLWECIFGLIRV